GSRLLRHWLHHPLRDRNEASARHDALAAIIEAHASGPLHDALRGMADVERITARIALKNARPRDLSGLRDGLARLPEIAALVPKPQSGAQNGSPGNSLLTATLA